MLDSKMKNTLLALAGTAVLMASSPVLAQDAVPATPAAATAPAADATAATPAPAADTAPAADAPVTVAETVGHGGGGITPISMFMDAGMVVKVVMIGLILASIFSWTLLLIKMFEFGALGRTTDRFLEAFRGARTIADMRRIATSDDFDGNPLADMAAAATEEVELSRQAGLSVTGDHRRTRPCSAPRLPSRQSRPVLPVACPAVSSSWHRPVRRPRSWVCSVPCTGS